MTRATGTALTRGCLGLIATALVLASLGACSVDRRSGTYRCANQEDCSGGRVCEQGWCVVPSMGTPDGGQPPACPAVCGSCVAGTCIIECDDGATCLAGVVCPPGLNCEVTCNGPQHCAGGVDCSQAGDCDVTCQGAGACGSGVICGAGACDVQCTGVGACSEGIDCSVSCSCDTDCDVDNGCGPAMCPGGSGGQCERSGNCSSAGCDFC